MLVILSLLFVQIMHTNYYKIVKRLKSFKMIIEGALSLCFAKVTMLSSVTYRCLKLSVLWLHIVFIPVVCVGRAL